MTAPILPSRRHFIRQLATGSAALSSSMLLSACGGGDGDGERRVAFVHGVASGDPLADRVILWTRATPDRSGRFVVDWEVARDVSFAQIVARGSVETSEQQDFTVKVDAVGLQPDSVYYYRFLHGSEISPVGRTRTLPVGSVSEVKLTVLSCANHAAGYFNVCREVATVDAHVAVFLGDYIYEHARGGYASQDAEALERLAEPAHECLTLADYRLRYAQYRRDADLQAFHAALPMIPVWDDHEIADNVWLNGAEGHNAGEVSFAARKAAALQAWHEWLPARDIHPGKPELIYRSFAFGDLLALHMLDTRVVARARSLNFMDYLGADGSFEAARFAADLASPQQQLLGENQTVWLQSQMATSSATWQVLGQQVLMARMNIPAPVAMQRIGFSDYAALVMKAQTAPQSLMPQEQAILAQPSIPYNLDAWDGYPVARDTVLGTARALGKNLVVLSGDTHNAWASNLADYAGNPVGVEFATASVSSPGLEELLPQENPQLLAAGLMQLIEPLKYANTGDRGYLVLTVTPQACTAQWRFVSTVKSRTYTAFAGPTLHTLAGSHVIAEV